MQENYKNKTKQKKAEAEKIMTKKQLKQCNIAIHSAAVASGAAGVIPIPVMDAVPISAVQLSMVLALGKIFDQKITESAAKGLIGAAASTLVGRALVKFIPIVGWGVSAAVAAGVTEAIGWTIAVDFAKGAKIPNTKQEPQNNMNYTENSSKEAPQKSEQEDFEKTKAELMQRAQPFLYGTKTAAENRDECDKLIKDIEDIFDRLEEDDKLREIYDRLSAL